MFQNIIAGLIVLIAVILLIRHFMKGKSCCGIKNSKGKSDSSSCGSCCDCSKKDKKSDVE